MSLINAVLVQRNATLNELLRYIAVCCGVSAKKGATCRAALHGTSTQRARCE